MVSIAQVIRYEKTLYILVQVATVKEAAPYQIFQMIAAHQTELPIQEYHIMIQIGIIMILEMLPLQYL